MGRRREACELAKRRLSSAEQTSIVLPSAPTSRRILDVEVPITRSDLEALFVPLLARLTAPIERALRDAGCRPGKLDEILLVGGATRMPCVARLAAQLFGRLPLRALPPDEAVALGAAVPAALKAGDAAVSDVVATDVAPFSLRMASAHRVGDGA